MSSKIKAAIIGYGKSGKNIHAPLIDARDDIILSAVLKRSGPDRLADRPDIELFRDMITLLKNDSITLVIITTPNHLHYRMAEQALNAGKHVVVDKPFTVTSNEAEKLIDLAEKKGRVLSVFQNRRWDGDFLTVAKLLNEKSVGRLVEFESNFNRFRSELRDDAWKEMSLPGSGILYDLGPHLIDQALQLFGKPDSLRADIRKQRGGDTDDWFEIDLYYNGFKAKLKAGMLIMDDTPRFVLRGDGGASVKYGFDPQEQALSDGVDPKRHDWGTEEESKFGILRFRKEGRVEHVRVKTAPGNYPHFYRNVVDAIQKSSELSVKPTEAKEVIRIIELAEKSNDKKKVLSVI